MDLAYIFSHAEDMISASENITQYGLLMSVTTVGIDLAEHVFHLYREDAHGKVLLRKRLFQAAQKPFLAR